jgi:hypothetical protein
MESLKEFTHLLIEASAESDASLKPFIKTHTIQSFVRGYDGFYFSWTKLNGLPTLKIILLLLSFLSQYILFEIAITIANSKN